MIAVIPLALLVGVAWMLSDLAGEGHHLVKSHKPKKLKASTMGSMGDAEPEKESSRLEKWLIATMMLTDPDEVADRARRMSAKYPDTAQIVMRRARELKAAQRAPKAPEAIYRASRTKDSAPIFNLKWSKFLLTMVRDISDVTQGHVGYFYFSWTRLVALKLATNLKKDGKTWTAELIPPPTLEEFLASSKLQYEAFVKSVLDYLPTLTSPRFQVFVGKVIDGKRITLSGLLAVSHYAGIDGLKSWLANPGDREKYPNTTAAFQKSTEIF